MNSEETSWQLHKRSYKGDQGLLAHMKIKELVKCVVSSGLNTLKAAHADFERSLVLISYTLSGVEYHAWHTPAFKGDQTQGEPEIITIQYHWECTI